MKKVLYLLLALAVPGLTFVFLKYGASNRFDIPVYPLANAPLYSECTGEVSGPYTVPDSVWQALQRMNEVSHLVVFDDNDLNAARIEAEIGEELGNVVSVRSGSELASDSLLLLRLRSCVFLLRPPHQSVLIDMRRQIRGQYDLRTRNEIDRMRVEIKILTGSYR